MTYQAFARKYRPQTWAAVMGQDHVTRTLANAVALNRIHHAYLLCGARGIGKTTIARLLAKTVNCTNQPHGGGEGGTRTALPGGGATLAPIIEPCNSCPSCLEITEGRSLDVQEIDGASNTSVDDVREIRERVKFLPATGKYKVYIIDEVHMLSTSAFNALLKTLEEPPPHVIFVFATTESQKIPATILSRCQRFDLRRLSPAVVIHELQRIAANEQITLDPVAAAVIARESDGSMRDAESLFDQAVACGDKAVDIAVMEQLLGLCDRGTILRTAQAILDRDATVLLAQVENLFVQGAQLPRFLQELITVFRHMWVIRACGGAVGMDDLLPDEVAQIEKYAAKVGAEELQQYIRILSEGVERLGRSRTPRLTAETVLLQTTLVQPVVPLESLVQRLEKLETPDGGDAERGPHFRQQPGPVIHQKTAAGPASGASWEMLLSRLNQDKPQLASILLHSLGHKMTAGGLSVVFPKGSIYADMLKESDRQALLKQLMAQYFGKPMTLDVALDDTYSVTHGPEIRAKSREEDREQNRKIKADAMQHTLVRDAVNILQAEIQEIKPLKE